VSHLYFFAFFHSCPAPAIDIDFIFDTDDLWYGMGCGGYTQYQGDYKCEKSSFALDFDSVEPLFDWTTLLQSNPIPNAIGTYREPLTVLNHFSPVY